MHFLPKSYPQLRYSKKADPFCFQRGSACFLRGYLTAPFLCRLFVIRNADKLGFIELLETTNVGRGLINLCMIAPGNHGYANSLRAHRPADLYRNQQSCARRQKLPRCHPERSVAESKDLVGKGEILRLAFGSLRMTHLFALERWGQDPTLQ